MLPSESTKLSILQRSIFSNYVAVFTAKMTRTFAIIDYLYCTETVYADMT